jgi:hypothetical protein
MKSLIASRIHKFGLIVCPLEGRHSVLLFMPLNVKFSLPLLISTAKELQIFFGIYRKAELLRPVWTSLILSINRTESHQGEQASSPARLNICQWCWTFTELG